MIGSLFILIPTLFLFVISGILIVTAISITKIFKIVGEPIFLHGAIIFVFLFLTFFTGAIGVYLSLDQTSHPLFLFNVFVISMTYIGIGFVYRNLSQGISIVDDYLHLLLLLAPSYAIAMMLGLEFSIIPGLVSQFIPLLLVLKMDLSIFSRIKFASTSFEQENDKKVLCMLKDVFFLSRLIHFLGIIAMISFGILALLGQELQAEEIWGANWQVFDYIYFAALLVLTVLFLKIFLRLRYFTDYILNADIPMIINSLLE